MGRRAVILGACLALLAAGGARADAPGPGCQPARPAVAHTSGGRVLDRQPRDAPVPCLTQAGPTADTAPVAVTPKGTILFGPIATSQGQGVPAPANILIPTAVARTTDEGARWSQVIPDDDPSDLSHQHSGIIPWLYADPVTGRVWYSTPNPCGAMISFSDDDGLSWHDADQVGCPGQGGMSVFEGPAPAGAPQPRGYPHVAYYCANLQDNGPHPLYCYKTLDGGATWQQVRALPHRTPPPRCPGRPHAPRGRRGAPPRTIYSAPGRRAP